MCRAGGNLSRAERFFRGKQEQHEHAALAVGKEQVFEMLRARIRTDALAIRHGACKVVVVIAVFDFKRVEERERFPRGGLNEHRHTPFNSFCGQREPLSASIVFNGDKAPLGRLRRITLRSWGKDNPQSPAATAPFKRGWQHRRC